jgi:hypothetical protein
VDPGSSCPNCPSPKELSLGEVETRIHKVLDSTVIPSPSIGPDPLQKGIASVRVSTLGLISVAFMILSFHYAHDLAHGLGDHRDESRDIDLFVDAPGKEATCASNGAAWMSKERESDRHAASWATRKWGMEIPNGSVPSGEGGMEWGVTRPSLLAGPSISEHQLKRLRARAGHLLACPSNLLPHGGLLSTSGRGTLCMLG